MRSSSQSSSIPSHRDIRYRDERHEPPRIESSPAKPAVEKKDNQEALTERLNANTTPRFSIKVSGLTRNTKETHLTEIFGAFGELQSVTLDQNKLHRKLNSAVLTFAVSQHAALAKEWMNFGWIDGNQIVIVFFDIPKIKVEEAGVGVADGAQQADSGKPPTDAPKDARASPNSPRIRAAIESLKPADTSSRNGQKAHRKRSRSRDKSSKSSTKRKSKQPTKTPAVRYTRKRSSRRSPTSSSSSSSSSSSGVSSSLSARRSSRS